MIKGQKTADLTGNKSTAEGVNKSVSAWEQKCKFAGNKEAGTGMGVGDRRNKSTWKEAGTGG